MSEPVHFITCRCISPILTKEVSDYTGLPEIDPRRSETVRDGLTNMDETVWHFRERYKLSA